MLGLSRQQDSVVNLVLSRQLLLRRQLLAGGGPRELSIILVINVAGCSADQRAEGYRGGQQARLRGGCQARGGRRRAPPGTLFSLSLSVSLAWCRV
jgi:hypothetical protein